MGKSYKKHGILKIPGYVGKTLANRNFRRTNKQRIKLGKEPLLQEEVTNNWDVIDYISVYLKKPEDRKNDKLKRLYFNK